MRTTTATKTIGVSSRSWKDRKKRKKRAAFCLLPVLTTPIMIVCVCFLFCCFAAMCGSNSNHHYKNLTFFINCVLILDFSTTVRLFDVCGVAVWMGLGVGLRTVNVLAGWNVHTCHVFSFTFVHIYFCHRDWASFTS